jgi:hypothetical protein
MRALFTLVVLLVAACATETKTTDGLVSVPSSKFDDLYLRPQADLSTYRAVLIEPVAVKFRSDFLTRKHGYNHLLAQPLHKPYQDPDSLAQDLASLMQASLVDAFRRANYEIAATPGPGVLRIAARIDELYVNAPDEMSSSVRVAFNRDTGQALLLLNASDSVSGDMLARIAHLNIVREVTRANLADDTTNRFWFETAFRRWAGSVTDAFGTSRRTTVSLTDQR